MRGGKEMNVNPICPWCSYEDKDWEENLSIANEDGATTETECPSCDKKYKVSLSVSYYFDTKATGCNHHELVPELYFTSGELHQYKCRLCSNCFYDWQLPDGRHPRLKEGQFTILTTKQGE